MQYAIVELEDGLSIVEVPVGVTLDEAAKHSHGVPVDETLYGSYEEACDALAELEPGGEED